LVTDLWDAVPDIEVPRHLVRSKVPFPDPAPEMTARMWENLRAARHEAHEEEDDSEYAITITQEAEEFDDPISPLAAYVKLAHAKGWTIHTLAHSLAFARGKVFKSGANEGQPRADQNIETQWLFAEKPGTGRVVVSYEIVNGTPRGAGVYRRFNGKSYSDRELKAIIKGTE
jgi:hypothetical protein